MNENYKLIRDLDNALTHCTKELEKVKQDYRQLQLQYKYVADENERLKRRKWICWK